jgi:hypothetical protein
MALIVADRVQETTNSTGTGAYTLGGAVPGFQTFASEVSNADTVYYSITDNVNFEVGLGTYASSGGTITRTTVFTSSNSNNAVNWGIGTKNIFLTYPADKAVIEDASNNVTIGNNLVVGGTVDGRDVATDGTKLDTVETNADVTDTANVTSAGAAMKANNLSDLPNKSTARTNLGVAIGSNVQAYSSVLQNTTASFLTADETKVDFITVTQAVDLDQMETDIAALENGMVYKGDWNAGSGSFPGGGSAQTGWFYYVSGAGTVNSISFAVGDNIVATTDNASTSTYASNWSKHDQTDAVQAVVGLTGSVSKSALLSALNVEDGADVTDTTNVTAAGALMDSEVTNLAQVKAFDTTDYATAAQGTKADAALPKAGGAMTGAITTNSTFDGRDVATDGTKLDGIESGATADQTNAEIRAAVEAATDSNVFTDADHSKLNGIEASADVTDTANVTAAGALMDSEVDGDIKTLSLPANTTISAFGKTLVDDADAATARSTLGLGTAATTASSAYATAAQGTKADAALPKAGGAMTGAITTNSTFDGRDVATDGAKLDGIAANANNYSFPYTVSASASNSTVVQRTGSGYIFANYMNIDPNTVSDGSITKVVVESGDDGYTRHSDATAMRTFLNVADGAQVNVPTNLGSGTSATDVTIVSSSGSNTTVPAATTSAAGCISAADKTKLDGIASGATNVTNNNQLTNGAGYITSYVNTTYSAGNGLDLSGTTFSLESDARGDLFYMGRDNNDYFGVETTQMNWVLDGATDMRLYNSGDLHVEGNVIAYSTTISDERLKKDIVKIDNALDKVSQLNGYTFEYLADGKKSAGVIAQEVEKVMPSAITESTLPLKMGDDDKTEYKTVQYDQLHGLMIEAIKELKAEIEELKAR